MIGPARSVASSRVALRDHRGPVHRSSASPSRCRPCPSTPGPPTPTRVPRPRSPPSWPWPRRPPASSGWSASSCSVAFELSDVVQPFMWILAAATMTIGNLIAIRQENIVRMLAYSGIAQAGYMLAPLAVYGDVPDSVQSSIVTYLVIYAAMNLGAFAVVIAAARKTRSGEISSVRWHAELRPRPHRGDDRPSCSRWPGSRRWVAGGPSGRCSTPCSRPTPPPATSWPSIAAVNSVIAAFYYLNVAKQMWFLPAPDGDDSPRCRDRRPPWCRPSPSAWWSTMVSGELGLAGASHQIADSSPELATSRCGRPAPAGETRPEPSRRMTTGGPIGGASTTTSSAGTCTGPDGFRYATHRVGRPSEWWRLPDQPRGRPTLPERGGAGGRAVVDAW